MRQNLAYRRQHVMPIGSHVWRTHVIANSMEWAKGMLDKVPDGTLFLADVHEHPRGRQGRVWQQMEGQLLITIALKPTLCFLSSDLINQALTYLTMAVSLGFLDPLLPYGVVLKWPNDYMLQGKKMGGLLCESVIKNGQLKGVIIGAGFNVNTRIAEHTSLSAHATSLYAGRSDFIDESGLMGAMLTSLDGWYARWCAREYATIFEKFAGNQGLIGKSISVHAHDGSMQSGVLLGVLPNGDAQIRMPLGSTITMPFCMVDYVAL